jgi:hypothetical protein
LYQELVEFDNESTGSNKNKEPPKSGVIISDLLDLNLTCVPENRETCASSISEEHPSALHTQNLSGVIVDSFFIERKDKKPAATVFPQTSTVVKEKQTTDSKSLESSRSEMHATSTSLPTSQRTNQIEATPAFANWDAEFQSASSVSADADSEQLDLFKGASAAESFSFPAAVTAINPVLGVGNETNVKSDVPEHSEGLSSAGGTLVKDNLFNQKVVHPILECSSEITPENSVPDFESSSLHKHSLRRDELRQPNDTGVNDDDAFDDWQDFTGGENQGSLSNTAKSNEEHSKKDSSKIKPRDPWPLGRMESFGNVNDDPSDDWQAFASSSGQEVEDLVKPVEGSTSGQEGGLVRLVEETTTNTLLEHPSQAASVDLWPMSNIDKHNTREVVKETNDSLDYWQDFTTSGQVQNISFSQTGDMVEALTAGQKEINLDSWFMGDSREAKNTDLVNANNAMLNDWRSLVGSNQSQQNASKNNSFEHRETTGSVQVSSSNKNAAKASSTNMDSEGFDVWQDFAKSGQVTVVSPEPTKETDAMEFWLTNSFKESSNREDARRIDDSSDGWQAFASFGQAQKSTIAEEGHLVNDPLGIETLNLWASNNEAEKKLEQVSGDNDLFDDWQDFKNSGETSLQVFSDASSLDRPLALKPDAVIGLEFGTISGLVSSRNQKDENGSSNVAKAIPFVEHSKRLAIYNYVHPSNIYLCCCGLGRTG